ncbi:MAG TPA: tetratricopeptide repeat protein [Acidobacteriota bacterium]|nr:tetratricopeptide repeat protein [Acidobacteriota bacterium]
MNTASKILGISTVVLAALAAVVASGCGSSSPAVQEVSINVTPEDQKVVYVDIFINLTGNAEFNLLEESIPEMLLTSLEGIRSVQIIPRDKLQKYLVVRSGEENSVSLSAAAKAMGADYMIDGWIDGTSDGKYRIYANLLNLANNTMRERFSAVEFDSKDQALDAANRLVTEIQDNLSLPREELETAEAKYADNYDIHRQYLRAWQSYNRGQPEVAVALFEKAIEMADVAYKHDPEPAKDEKRESPANYFRFLAGQIYNELGNEERARELFKPVYENRKSFSKYKDVTIFIEAVWAELQGDYGTAKRLYREVRDSKRFGSEYYLRMAHIALKEGGEPKYAIKIIKKGLEAYPDEALLRKRYAELEFMIEGDKAVERYTGEAAEKKSDPVSAEVASSLVNEKMLGDSLEQLSRALPAVSVVKSPRVSVVRLQNEYALSMSVAGFDINIKIDDLKELCDAECEESIDGAALLATLAANKGKAEIALEIAGLISASVTVPQAEDVGNRIRSIVAMSEGRYAEAEKFAMKISAKDPNRFITLGNIYLRLGEPDKAAQIMEKALKVGKDISPIVYYHVANANLLAGNYKKWDFYTKLFLKETTERNKAARLASGVPEQ